MTLPRRHPLPRRQVRNMRLGSAPLDFLDHSNRASVPQSKRGIRHDAFFGVLDAIRIGPVRDLAHVVKVVSIDGIASIRAQVFCCHNDQPLQRKTLTEDICQKQLRHRLVHCIRATCCSVAHRENAEFHRRAAFYVNGPIVSMTCHPFARVRLVKRRGQLVPPTQSCSRRSLLRLNSQADFAVLDGGITRGFSSRTHQISVSA